MYMLALTISYSPAPQHSAWFIRNNFCINPNKRIVMTA